MNGITLMVLAVKDSNFAKPLPTDRLSSFKSISELRTLILSLTISIVGSFALLGGGLILNYPDIVQVSLEFLFVTGFLFMILFSGKRHGSWIYLVFLFEFVAIGVKEIEAIFIDNSYILTGFILAIPKESTPALPSGGYPVSVLAGWIVCIFACYNLTNIVFCQIRVRIRQPVIAIVLLSILDGIILWEFSLFFEAAGIDLGWWAYPESSVPKLSGAPIDT
ncbi:MAG TPA: hypothetical protein VJ044_01255, partial [Candidatus Hodarchaeales archaeon]|nr:hypothetical protein [Candidatus Hodarchaeales archaeon]